MHHHFTSDLAFPFLNLIEVESSKYCRAVIQARQHDGMLPAVPVRNDVTTVTGSEARAAGAVGAGGGFPCQAWTAE